MKKNNIIISTLMISSLVGCSNLNTGASSSFQTEDGHPTYRVPITKGDTTYISDSEWQLDNYSDYASYIFSKLHNGNQSTCFETNFRTFVDFMTSSVLNYSPYDNYFLLYPDCMAAYESHFSVSYEKGDESQYEDAMVYETYYVYDKSLGNDGSAMLENDIIRASFEIYTLFFPAKAGKDFNLELTRISNDEAVVYVTTQDEFVGYVYTRYMNEEKIEFLMDYLNDNLFSLNDGTN